MQYEVKYTDAALDDIDSIDIYLSQFYPSTPDNFKIELNKCHQLLTVSPRTFPKYELNPLYRKAVVLKYIVFFTVDDENLLVIIHRVLRGAWDLGKYL
jgi:plasmid stabilization system protein ParE